MPGTLFIVGTPIGNLADISERALDTLKNVDLIACEDTRHSGKLLSHFGFKKKLVSFHDHNEASRTDSLIKRLEVGESIALISDAGMPLISDPGFRLVRTARQVGIEIRVIPGPTAFVSAAVISGLPLDSLFFGGFLPSKANARRKLLASLREISATLIFYESANRIKSTLADCLEVLGPRPVVVVRELTKLHEETIVGNPDQVLQQIEKGGIKGELVLLIGRKTGEVQVEDIEEELAKRVKAYLRAGEDKKSSLKRAAKELGIGKSEAYRIMLDRE